jgi:NAD+ synthase
MSLHLSDPQTTIAEVMTFLRDTYLKQEKRQAVIAISGGIDSAISLTLLAQSLPNTAVFPLLLPYGQQEMGDAIAMCDFNNIPEQNRQVINIQPMVESIIVGLQAVQGATISKDRIGNVMARVRMIVMYDTARMRDALVCGTENRSEYLLGYYTRYGDEASDLEPIHHLYKTQVRQLAEHLALPESIQKKAPTAGLWEGQTDEGEFGFSYADADVVLHQFVDEKKSEQEIVGVDPSVVNKVISRLNSQQYKHHVPYTYEKWKVAQ